MESTLDLGADINYATDGETPLLCCILEDFPEGIQILLDHDANMSSLSCPAAILLLAAFAKESISIIDVLLEHGAHIDAVVPRPHPSLRLLHSKVPRLTPLYLGEDSVPGRALLHIASELSDTAMIELVLQYGANVNQRDDKGITALYIYSQGTSLQATKVLLSSGADHDITDEYDRTALHFTAQAGSIEMVELLLSVGSKINASTKDGWTPLSVAVWERSLQVVEFLLRKGADPNGAGTEMSPLCVAAELDELSIAKTLIVSGANVDMRDARGKTPLCSAAAKNSRQVVELLLAKGADVSAILNAEQRFTALHIAAKFNACEVATLLIENGASVNSLEKGGWTPLHYAADCGSLEMVRLLVHHGANVTKETKKGNTPLDVAKGKDSKATKEMIDYLSSLSDLRR
jgi:ankyrin repeat protein